MSDLKRRQSIVGNAIAVDALERQHKRELEFLRELQQQAAQQLDVPSALAAATAPSRDARDAPPPAQRAAVSPDLDGDLHRPRAGSTAAAAGAAAHDAGSASSMFLGDMATLDYF